MESNHRTLPKYYEWIRPSGMCYSICTETHWYQGSYIKLSAYRHLKLSSYRHLKLSGGHHLRLSGYRHLSGLSGCFKQHVRQYFSAQGHLDLQISQLSFVPSAT